MEHDDWGPVISRIEHDHYNNQEAVAKAFSVTLMGDDIDWRQHMTNAARFISEMNRTIPHCPKCDLVEPILWRHFHQETVFPDGSVDVFTGMTAECRSCKFEIAKLGNVSKRQIA